MQNAKRCGCSYQQSNSCYAGERIRVNSASSCGNGRESYRCQESCRVKPCKPKTGTPRPCAPRSCEDECVDQYRRCMKSCRHDNGCRDRSRMNCCDDFYGDFDSCYGNCYDWDWAMYGNCYGRPRRRNNGYQHCCEEDEQTSCEQRDESCDRCE